MNLHEFVKNVRVKKGITQKILSEKTGIRQAAISNFEKGKAGINSKSLELIFKELDICIVEGPRKLPE